MCCYRCRLVFNCCFEDTDILQDSVATHLKCGGIFRDSIITNVLLILRVKKSLKIGQYFTKLRRTKQSVPFWPHVRRDITDRVQRAIRLLGGFVRFEVVELAERRLIRWSFIV